MTAETKNPAAAGFFLSVDENDQAGFFAAAFFTAGAAFFTAGFGAAAFFATAPVLPAALCERELP